MSMFQSTPPRGRRRGAELNLIQRCKFQSTPPRGRRPPAELIRLPDELRFQSTPPRGRRRNSTPTGYAPHIGFNPRPRVGGDRQARIPAPSP